MTEDKQASNHKEDCSMDDEYKQKVDYLMYCMEEIRKRVETTNFSWFDLFVAFDEWKNWNENKNAPTP